MEREITDPGGRTRREFLRDVAFLAADGALLGTGPFARTWIVVTDDNGKVTDVTWSFFAG